MIEIKINKGNIENAHIEGSGAQIIAESGCMIKSMCKQISKAEKNEVDELQAYAYFMTSIASAIIHLLDEEMVLERLNELVENK